MRSYIGDYVKIGRDINITLRYYNQTLLYVLCHLFKTHFFWKMLEVEPCEVEKLLSIFLGNLVFMPLIDKLFCFGDCFNSSNAIV